MNLIDHIVMLQINELKRLVKYSLLDLAPLNLSCCRVSTIWSSASWTCSSPPCSSSCHSPMILMAVDRDLCPTDQPRTIHHPYPLFFSLPLPLSWNWTSFRCRELWQCVATTICSFYPTLAILQLDWKRKRLGQCLLCWMKTYRNWFNSLLLIMLLEVPG